MICKINFGKWLGTHAAGELKNDSGKSRKFRLPHSTQKSQSTLSLWHFKGPSKKVGVVRSMACDVALEQVLHGQMCVCVFVFLRFLLPFQVIMTCPCYCWPTICKFATSLITVQPVQAYVSTK